MVQSVERAFDVLAAVAGGEGSVTAIARAVVLPKSTAARLLATLEGIGVVERDRDGAWRVGARVGELAGPSGTSRSLELAARPVLAALARDLGEDAGLAVPEGHAMRYVLQVDTDNAVQVRDWTGTRAPMHTVPSGLVLMAEWTPAAVRAYTARGLERLTPATVGDLATLERRLADIRRSGLAWGFEEFVEGICSVAVPVRDAAGRAVAAIHVHGPSYRFPEPGTEVAVIAALTGAGEALSRGDGVQ
jgi:IclR family pca regulon transcriptional regulator